jgi:hypothetical protein
VLLLRSPASCSSGFAWPGLTLLTLWSSSAFALVDGVLG